MTKLSSFRPISHQRRSIRLPGYDYTQAGAYFITLCTLQHQPFFGEIKDEEMMLNQYGEIVQAEWLLTGVLRENLTLGAYCIMPNHFHGIIIIEEPEGQEGMGTTEEESTGTARRAPTASTKEQFSKPVVGSIPTIVRAFKSATTKSINTLQQTPGRAIWQRNYYEHIIHDDNSYAKITEYILNNPVQWALDRSHPGEKR